MNNPVNIKHKKLIKTCAAGFQQQRKITDTTNLVLTLEHKLFVFYFDVIIITDTCLDEFNRFLISTPSCNSKIV